MPRMKSQYWTKIDRSRPSEWWISARRLGLQDFPHTRRPGSPGSAKNRKNVIAETTARIAAALPMRRATYRVTIPLSRCVRTSERCSDRFFGRNRGRGRSWLDEDAVQRDPAVEVVQSRPTDPRPVDLPDA